MKRLILILSISVFLGFAGKTSAQEYYQEDKWPNLKFFVPVAMHTAPDNSKRVFVIEQNGRIKVFKDSGTVGANDTTTFLNLRNRIGNITPGNETGLLGMAFHPNFSQNGFVYVNYTTASPVVTYVSRFKLDSLNPNRLLTNSEKRIFQVNQPFSNHNAGSLLFGDDGYLYITMGDGGSGGDPGNRAQNKSEFLGKIVRIDVNVPENGPAYLVPADNPLVNNTQNWKKEIYAWGLRNPWKMTKDPELSTIWIGDVGQNAFEEVDTLRKGANYGWKVMEGNSQYSACNGCDTSNYEKPLQAYNRAAGISITGGYVYRGTELHKLKGVYFYADYSTQKIWNLKKGQNGVYQNLVFTLPTPGPISSFGLDNEKELYTVRYSANQGKLLKIRCGPPTPVIATPAKTSVCAGDSIVVLAPVSADVVGYKWSTGDTTNKISLRQEGIYNLTLQTRNSFGCWSYFSQPIRLKINPKPLKPIVSDVNICQGDTAEVTLSSLYFYNWSANGNQNSFSTINQGQYWVRALDSVGCKSDTGFFSVVVLPVPTTPGITQNGNDLTTNPVTGGSYKWFLDGVFLETTSNPIFSPIISGSYTLVVVSQQGCQSQISNPLVFVSNLKISNGENDVILMPNPVKDELSMVIKSVKAVNTVVYDFLELSGKSILKGSFTGIKKKSDLKISTRNLPKGPYFVKINLDGKSYLKRIIKE